jgi:hypothetical protein
MQRDEKIARCSAPPSTPLIVMRQNATSLVKTFSMNPAALSDKESLKSRQDVKESAWQRKREVFDFEIVNQGKVKYIFY